MSTQTSAELSARSLELKRIALTMIYEAQSGHPGGAFSAADLISALYFHELHLDLSLIHI